MSFKYLINNNEIIMGDVDFHADLISPERRTFLTLGGGKYHLDEQGKCCYFFGLSTDFGAVTKEQFKIAVSKSLTFPLIEGYEIYWSSQLSITEAVRVGWHRIK